MAGERPVLRRSANVIQPPARQWFVDYLPVTADNQAELFIDGESYGQSLFDALGQAKSQVLLTGLHFDPDWQLVRGAAGGPSHSLLAVLEQLGKRGVSVYLLVNQFWRSETGEVGFVQNAGGARPSWSSVRDPIRSKITHAGHLDWYVPMTARLFEGLKDVPKVECRTDVHRGFVMSTHHQKTVVIDERIAFLGGIDMTAVDGDRWDTNAHEIPAAEAGEVRRSALPEKLWHDIHCKVEGPAVRMVLDNFHARWNHGHLYKDLSIRTRTVTYTPPTVRTRGMGPTTLEYPETYLHAVEDAAGRHQFPRIEDPGGVYQTLTRNEPGAPEIVSRRGRKEEVGKCLGPPAIAALSGTKVQIVRSMPSGRYTLGAQKPEWNLSELDWERSAKDAYLVGIRAARKYIYLENQWISDEDIWKELARAAHRNRDDPDFRIVVVIPRNPLAAAGYGANQDVDLRDEVGSVIARCKDANQFGMYCLVAPVPASRRSTIGLSEEDIENYGDDTAQIYVHSKVLIVDDCWALIGSANAGGISLEGVRNPGQGFAGSTPDTELSAIIYDEAFASDFRGRVWAEHLEDPSASGKTPVEAADMFRARADAGNARVRYARDYDARLNSPMPELRRVAPEVVEAVKESAALTSTAGAEVRLGESAAFMVELTPPSPAYELHYRWSLRDSSDKAWLMRGIPTERIVQSYGPEAVAYIPPDTAAALQQKMQGSESAKVLCRVMITPVGVSIRRSGSDQRKHSFLLELPVTLRA